MEKAKTKKRNRELAAAQAGEVRIPIPVPPPSTRRRLRNDLPGSAQPSVAQQEPEQPGVIPLVEQGTSGLRSFMGFVTEAYNARLQWPEVEPLYRRLVRSVPEIVIVRQAFTTWARGVDLVCDLPDNPTDDDKKFQDFFYQAINQDLEGGQETFKDTLVSNVPFYGWGWWEVVPGIRDPGWVPPTVDPASPDEWRSQFDDGLIGLRRIAWRAPSSFYSWEFDPRKHLTGMVQQDFPQSNRTTIKLTNSFHSTFGDSNNPEGLTPLEAVWRLERLRFGLEVVQGIGFEHSAGYLNVKKVSTGAISTTDQNKVREAARNILTAQEGNYAFWPEGIEGEVKDTPFQAAQALLQVIQHYSVLMLMVYMMSFVGLNTMTGTGSRAATSDVSQMGVVNFNSMMSGFAGQFQRQIFRRLWNWNRASFPQSQGLHRLRFTPVSKDYALTDLSQFIESYGGLFRFDDNDILAIRKRSGFLPEAVPEAEAEPSLPTANGNRELVQLAFRHANRKATDGRSSRRS